MVSISSGLADAIGAGIGARLQPQPAGRVHGGSISECYRWESSAGRIFVKVGEAGRRSMFESEAAGLTEPKRAQAVRAPEVLSVGATSNGCWLALEWIDLRPPSSASDAVLGERLALQHRSSARAFGWHRDNTIGATPQENGWLDDWLAFFKERRLRYQLDLARRNGYPGHLQRQGEALLERLGELFETHRPIPSLLHGDLWGGNRAADEQGGPVIFDPAVYYGDREADLAMTRLFGSFSAEFYSAYEAAWPLDEGAPLRIGLYNLYHVLNHLNLFGAGYLAQAQALIERLLAQI
jgi:fructosamine-3-kinase